VAKRNFLLEMLDGPRTYLPPPGYMLVRCVDAEATRGGIITPTGVSEGGGQAPLGEVLSIGTLKDEYKDSGAPASVGDFVMFTPQLMPITDVHDDIVCVHCDCVMLTIRMGEKAESGGVFHDPEALYEEPSVLSIID